MLWKEAPAWGACRSGEEIGQRMQEVRKKVIDVSKGQTNTDTVLILRRGHLHLKLALLSSMGLRVPVTGLMSGKRPLDYPCDRIVAVEGLIPTSPLHGIASLPGGLAAVS